MYSQWFSLWNQLAETRFDLSKLGEDCSDAGKEPLDNVGECEAAAQKLGKNFQREDTWSVFPKGCVLYTGSKNVFWNNHETGGKIGHMQAICKNTGKYMGLYVIDLSYVNRHNTWRDSPISSSRLYTFLFKTRMCKCEWWRKLQGVQGWWRLCKRLCRLDGNQLQEGLQSMYKQMPTLKTIDIN